MIYEFFQASIRNWKNCVYNCEDHSSFDFTFVIQYMMYFIYHFIRAFSVVASRLWNQLPLELRSVISVDQFKMQLTTYLLKSAV